MEVNYSSLIGSFSMLFEMSDADNDTRKRWRALRRANVQRERDADARDAAAEAKQLSLTEKASDAFLNQAMFSHVASTSSDPSTSLPRLNSDEPIVKLSFGSSVVKPIVKPPAPVRPSALGIADEEEEGKVKRELVKLDYSGLDLEQSDDDRRDRRRSRRSRSRSQDGGRRERSRERTERPRGRDSREKERILAQVPTSQSGLYKFIIDWSLLSEVRPFPFSSASKLMPS